MSIANEAAKYFREKKGFDRLFIEFERRYKGLERIGGNAILEPVTDEEFNTIRGVIGDKLKRKGDRLSVPLLLFEEKLQSTKFAGITLLTLLETYFGRKIVTNKEKQLTFEQEKECFLTEIHQAHPGSNADFILEKIREKSPGTLQVHALYQQDKKALRSVLSATLKAVNKLPLQQPKRLALFASDVTNNPHYFDIKTEAGRLLISFLQLLLEIEGRIYKTNVNAEEITDILSSHGIWRDDVLNFVSCYGIRGYKDNGETFKVLDGAIEENSICNLLLRDMFRIKRIETYRQKVFVVENSSLYSSLIEEFQDKPFMPSIVCTHGQMKLSALMLLDKIAESGNVIYYSGDHDPQGLSIAESLAKRLKSKVKFWRFETESYLLSLSDELFDSETMLTNIKEPQLQSLIQVMLEHRKSAFQEKLIEHYYDDILRELTT
ncbi:TIGR02679 domain-containing protein [Paenibacillus qinlingensis]|uniref:Uncharacterized protein (TIGR02679 family) n=1 Tax=Paenibacillus qinlingensis TaxID=1837343 RepID=A0ABU1P2J2_9BACL|nr:TIGR02679 domain-containing protein [Paenibacillus qinlingensis]MDR6553965.1 uncharacterized protein (TIGR02679 family) [Paenibacillus qinlingensis]